jgi:hypothetical protein
MLLRTSIRGRGLTVLGSNRSSALSTIRTENRISPNFSDFGQIRPILTNFDRFFPLKNFVRFNATTSAGSSTSTGSPTSTGTSSTARLPEIEKLRPDLKTHDDLYKFSINEVMQRF